MISTRNQAGPGDLDARDSRQNEGFFFLASALSIANDRMLDLVAIMRVSPNKEKSEE